MIRKCCKAAAVWESVEEFITRKMEVDLTGEIMTKLMYVAENEKIYMKEVTRIYTIPSNLHTYIHPHTYCWLARWAHNHVFQESVSKQAEWRRMNSFLSKMLLST